jgi:Protein of unknown function (DUF2889)
MTIDDRPSAPRDSAGAAPPRRPGSIRRTSSIDTTWPDGRAGTMRMIGRARDAITLADGGLKVCAEDLFRARLQWDRTIVEIEAEPNRPNIHRLVGARGGGYLRKALDELLPEERRNATPLHLILDDVSGASLVAGWAWSRWTSDWLARSTSEDSAPTRPVMRNMEGVCTGFRPGSSALAADGTSSRQQNHADVIDLRNPADPEGWHEFTLQSGAVGMRRARRIDVWLSDGLIQVDSAFQDSATNPEGGRTAVHEYRLTATADPISLKLLSVEAEPRVLPFAECPAATLNVGRMVGAPLNVLREKVLEDLRGTAGCTHLNDALRALAEVPSLARRLEPVQPAPV